MNTPCAKVVAESGSDGADLLSTRSILSPVLNIFPGKSNTAVKFPCSSVESTGTLADTVA